MQTLSLTRGSSDEGFVVKPMAGCWIVFGTVPVSELARISQAFGDQGLADADLADRLSASFVIGEPDNLADLRQHNLPISERREREASIALARGLPHVAEWLRIGERGLSSNALCQRIFGLPLDAGKQHPRDVDDLHHCIAFLDATSAHDKVSIMQDLSPSWARLVRVWEYLVFHYREELQHGEAAPKTYALLKSVVD